jgi:hypothetical protein
MKREDKIMEKLKVCPFCGTEPVLKERKRGQGKYAIGCPNISCFLYLPDDVKKSELHNYTWCYAKLENLITAWNTRVKE